MALQCIVHKGDSMNYKTVDPGTIKILCVLMRYCRDAGVTDEDEMKRLLPILIRILHQFMRPQGTGAGERSRLGMC